MRAALSLLLLLLAAAVPAVAQLRAPPFESAPAPFIGGAGDPAADTTAPRMKKGHRMAIRTLGGAAGIVVGGGAGLLVGGAWVRHARDDTNDDFAGLGGLVLSTLVGGSVGMGVGAGLPRLGAPCNTLRRVALGTLAGISGVTVGSFVGEKIGAPGVGLVAGAGIGAAIGADC